VLKIKNLRNDKEFFLKEHQRVRVKTNRGDKIIGRLLFLDSSKILVDGKVVNLVEVEKIKKNPLALTIPSSILTGTIFIGSIPFLTGDISGTRVGLLYSVFGPLNILRGYNKKNYNFEVNTLK